MRWCSAEEVLSSVVVQRCRGADVQRCRGAQEVQVQR